MGNAYLVVTVKSSLCVFTVNKNYAYINTFFHVSLKKHWGFPGGAVVETLPANAGDTGSSPGLGRSHMPRSD